MTIEEFDKLPRKEKIKIMSRFLEQKKESLKTDILISDEELNPAIDSLLEKYDQIHWACLINAKNPKFDKLSSKEINSQVNKIKNKIDNTIIYEIDRILEYNGLLILGIDRVQAIQFGIELNYDAIFIGSMGAKAKFIPRVNFEKSLVEEKFIIMNENERRLTFLLRTKSEEPTEYDELLMDWWIQKKEVAKEEFQKMSDQQRLSMYHKRISSDTPTEFDDVLFQWWRNRY